MWDALGRWHGAVDDEGVADHLVEMMRCWQCVACDRGMRRKRDRWYGCWLAGARWWADHQAGGFAVHYCLTRRTPVESVGWTVWAGLLPPTGYVVRRPTAGTLGRLFRPARHGFVRSTLGAVERRTDLLVELLGGPAAAAASDVATRLAWWRALVACVVCVPPDELVVPEPQTLAERAWAVKLVDARLGQVVDAEPRIELIRLMARLGPVSSAVSAVSATQSNVSRK